MSLVPLSSVPETPFVNLVDINWLFLLTKLLQKSFFEKEIKIAVVITIMTVVRCFGEHLERYKKQ